MRLVADIYYSRPDLQQAFPEAATGNSVRLMSWARAVANGDCEDGSHLFLKPLATWLNAKDEAESVATNLLVKAGQDHAERTTEAEYEPALHALLSLYRGRSDLRQSFPEAVNWDFRRLIDWARRVSAGEWPDNDATLLQPFQGWFVLNAVDLSSAGLVPWDLLTATSALAANPLCNTYQQMRSPKCVDIGEHLVTLGMLVTEFNLRQVLEVGTREGYSTVALLEAVIGIGGHVLSIDIEPCPNARQLVNSLGLASNWTFRQLNALALEDLEIPKSIDLLFIDTFHLYSQTIAELRKFVPYVRPGGWVVLHDSVSFSSVSRAVLEVIQSLTRRPRFYSFVHRNGLTIFRLADT